MMTKEFVRNVNIHVKNVSNLLKIVMFVLILEKLHQNVHAHRNTMILELLNVKNVTSNV